MYLLTTMYRYNVQVQWWQFAIVGSDIGQIKEVALRRTRLVLGWVTVLGFNSWC